MVGSLDTAQRLTEASGTGDHREIRIRFESHTALLDGLALAEKESWVEDCHVVFPRLELVIRMAGGFWIDPGPDTAPRRGRPAAPAAVAQAW
jgi:hypothetical protein